MKCNFCDYQSNSINILSAHTASHHKEKIKPKPEYIPNPNARDGREFYIHSKRFPTQPVSFVDTDITDEICFGRYDDSDKHGEMIIEWVRLGVRSVPRLKVFDDAWRTLADFSDVIAFMATVNDKNISVEEMAKALESLGFDNYTYKPY